MPTQTMFRIVFLVLLFGLVVMRGYFTLQVRRAGERVMPDSGAIAREGGAGVFIARVVGFFLLLALLVSYIIGSAWIEALAFPLPAVLRWAGFALGLISLAFWTWTQAALGKEWSPQLQLREKHHLVTTGPYERMRHPLYTAMFGWVAALALLTANWIFTIIAVLTVIALIARVPKEEQMMIEAFGEEYQAYMRNTGKFFPK